MMKAFFAFAALGAIGAYFTFFKLTPALAESTMEENISSIYEIKATSLTGKEVDLSNYKGKVLLIVNTASKCGYTPQYEDLEKLYKEYKDKGVVVLGFPSNDFLWQEPGTDEEIAKFCKLNYGVTFPMFRKDSVKGKKIQPVFSFLTTSGPEDLTGKVKWNFEKFIVGKDGKVASRFKSSVNPMSDQLISELEKALNA